MQKHILVFSTELMTDNYKMHHKKKIVRKRDVTPKNIEIDYKKWVSNTSCTNIFFSISTGLIIIWNI